MKSMKQIAIFKKSKNGNRIRMVIIAICLSFQFLACNDDSSNKMATNEPGKKTADNTGRIDENKALVLKFYQALSDTDWRLAYTLINKAYEHHYVADTGFASVGWKDFEKGYRASLKAFPDWKLTPLKVVADGEYVSVLLVGKGTHLGDFAGITATKIKASAPIMILHQVKDGKLIADWEIMNTGLFIKQLMKH